MSIYSLQYCMDDVILVINMESKIEGLSFEDHLQVD